MRIEPFIGHALKHKKNIKDIISLPFEVANHNDLDKYHPHHIARITNPRLFFGSHPDNNSKHNLVSKLWAKWIDEKVIVPVSEKPIFYLYEQTFTFNKKTYTRTGLLAKNAVKDWNKCFFPHEATYQVPTMERLKTLESTNFHLAPSLGVIEDKDHSIDEYLKLLSSTCTTFYETVDDLDIRHCIKVVDDDEHINALRNLFLNKKGFLADGHHRVEALLKFYENDQDAFHFINFTSEKNEGLLSLPTHRLVKIGFSNLTHEEIERRLGKYFDVEKKLVSEITFEVKRMFVNISSSDSFLFVYDNCFYFISPRENHKKSVDEIIIQDVFEKDYSDLLENGQAQFIRGDSKQTFKLAKETLSDPSQIMIIQQPYQVSEILNITKENKILPQKSTFFFPKVYSGFMFLEA